MDLLETDIYAITAEEYSLGRSNVEVVKEMLDAGIRIVQYRAKEKTMLQRFRECLQIRDLTATHGVMLVINDHLDLALAVEADGVHLGQDDLPLEKARELVTAKMFIGLSTHSPQQARKALAGGADYIGVGPIYETRTKKDVCSPVGLDYLDFVVREIPLPFVAIGGIKEHNIKDVCSHGATCISMVTEIVGAEDIPGKIRDLRQKIEQAGRGA